MRKSSVEKLQMMAQGFLQCRYKIWLTCGKREADWCHYLGACEMIEAIGGTWKRHYCGDLSDQSRSDIRNYSHTVWFPDDDDCKRLNIHAWDE